MVEVVLDLRVKPEGCTDHPIVRLNKMLKEARSKKDVKIILYANLVDLPPRVIEIIAKKNKLKVESIESGNGEVKAILSLD
mgnify:CR=1 FL=1